MNEATSSLTRAGAKCLISLILFLSLCACSQVPIVSSDKAPKAAAVEMLTLALGGEKGSSREALVLSFIQTTSDNPVFMAVMNNRPRGVSYETFYSKLEREGSAMLTDDKLRQFAQLHVKLLDGATPEECSSFIEMSKSGAIFGGQSEKWRMRLARASDEDIWQSLQFSKEAVFERSKRINEIPLEISEDEFEIAFRYLLMSMSSAVRDEILGLMEKADKSGTGSNNDVCRLATEIRRVQAGAHGPEARIPLRIAFATVKN